MHGETMASGVYLPELEDVRIQRGGAVHAFEFYGNARDYFRIWIVNVALSIVTLGIYSAWASVRTRRYLYANTLFKGSPFEYMARPLPILRGRLIAAALFVTYVTAAHFARTMQLATMGVVGVLMPWLIVKGLMFRARYSTWRGLHFRFIADYAGAYQWYLLVYILMALPLGLLGLLRAGGHPIAGFVLLLFGVCIIYPWMKGNQQQWMAEHHYFGGKSFRFTRDPGTYYRIYGAGAGIALLCVIPAVLVIGVLGVPLLQHHYDPRHHRLVFTMVVYLLMSPLYLIVWTYVHVRMTNALYNQTHLARYRLLSALGFGAMLRIYFGNALAILFTLGLATPWARIRVARYRASCLVVTGDGDLDEFVQSSSEAEVTAAGTEIDSLLGFDIGL